MASWFVVHTQPNGEQKAVFHLLRQGFQPYLPRYLKRRRHARRVEWVQRPLFPRYLFVRLDLECARWRAINSTVGVSHLICDGPRPAALADRIVDEIRTREDDSGLIALNAPERFRPGQAVRIDVGAFDDHVGLFEAASDNDRVTVLLSLLGRHVRVNLPLDGISALA